VEGGGKDRLKKERGLEKKRPARGVGELQFRFGFKPKRGHAPAGGGGAPTAEEKEEGKRETGFVRGPGTKVSTR